MLRKKSLLLSILLVLFSIISANAIAGTLYWVGNGGNWNDVRHWARTSGGAPGAGIPGSTDDVVFDLNSFDNPGEQVTILATASCHTFQVMQDVYNPVLVGSSTTSLEIYGSIMSEGPMQYAFAGTIHFKSTQPNNIINPGAIKLNNVAFDGSGSWKMFSMLYATNITLESGSLIANGFEIAATNFTVAGTGSKTLDFSKSILYIEQQFNDATSSGLNIISTGGKLYYEHYLIGSLAAIAHTPHRVLAVDSSHFSATGELCHYNPSPNGCDSLGNGPAPCDGKAWITNIYADDGGPFGVVWTGSGTPSANTDTLDNACPPAVSYQIADTFDNSLTVPTVVTINNPNKLAIAYTVRPPKCDGYCDAWIRYEVLGGTPSYTYFWYGGGPSGATPGGIGNPLYDSSLCQGSYKIHIEDSKSCHNTLSPIKITNPLPVTVTITSTPPTCASNCNGTAKATGSGGHGAPWTYLWSNGETTQTAINLCAGTYTVTVFDDSLCSGTSTVTIIAPTPVTITPSHTNATCNGSCDGTATAKASGGTPGYTYLWTPSAQTTSTATALCAGTYKVVVTDANGCKDSTNITITQPNPLTAGLTATNNPLPCNGDCIGSISVSPAGGTAPYSYSWSNGASTNPINNLCAGKYVVTVTDAHGCTTKDSVTFTQPTAINVTVLSTTNPVCNGSCTGTATISVSGGSPGYTFSWSNGATTSNLTNLCAGSYTLTVKDKHGCVDSATVITITQPTAISVTMKITEESCNGSCDGIAVANVSGGTPSYTYKWDTGPILTADSVAGFCSGNDSVKVTDSKGCTTTAFFTITQPTPLSTIITANNSTCALCNGSAAVKVLGGTPPYTYSWTTIPVQTTDSAVNLCAGNYTVTIYDADSCKIIQPVKIVPIVKIVITSSATGLTCFGSCDGTASANASGGTTPYTYTWSDGQTTSTATNLCAGTYTITVQDAAGCVNTDSVTFINPPPVVGVTAQTNVSCNGSCVGTASVTASGGTGPYTYSWSNGATTSSINGLCQGQYIVTITDSKSCSTNDTVNIAQAPAIGDSNVIISPTCKTANGSITVYASGGLGGYTYSWSTGATTSSISGLGAGSYTVTITDSVGCGQSFVIPLSNTSGPTLGDFTKSTTCWGSCDGYDSVFVVAGTGPYTYAWSTGSTTTAISSLCPGPYVCTVTDALGCITNEEDTIKRPTPINPHPTVTNITCNGSADGTISFAPTGGNGGYTYTWSPSVSTTSSATNLGPGVYTFTVADSKGCDTIFSLTITQPPALSVVMTFTNVTCNGSCDGMGDGTVSGGTPPYIYSWSNGAVLPNVVLLCPGTYTLNVTDANGCKTSGTITITQPPVLTGVMSSTNVTCAGGSSGSATVTASGGSVPYSYSWNNGATTSSITFISVGTYVVTVTDLNGCTFTDSVSITQPTPVNVVMSETNTSCNGDCNGTATATASGGTPGYTYAWNDGQTTSTATNLCIGTYIVNVTDANGCSASNSVTVSQPTPIAIVMGSTDTKCPSSCDGSASISASGGTPPYSYTWSNGATTTSINSLCAGTYSVLITDAHGCIDSGSVIINNPAPITSTTALSPSNCGVCNGSIAVTPSGGTPGYTYNWSTGSTISSISGACAGVYSYTVTDANSCTASFTVILSNSSGPTGITLTQTNDSCSGSCDGQLIVPPTGGTPPYTYTFNGGPSQSSDTASSLCANSYTIIVTDAAGCQFTDTTTVTQPTPITATITSTQAACLGHCNGTIKVSAVSGGTPPYTYLWSSGQTVSSLVGMCPGTYTVTITDKMKCTLVEIDSVTAVTTIAPTITSTNPLCYGSCTGTATLSATGGTLPYSYSWSNGALVSNISALCAGGYTVTLTDKNGCQAVDSARITTPGKITVTFNNTPVTCNGSCDGKMVATASGGTPGYTYSWNPSSSSGTTDSLTSLCPGTETITVTDNNGCVLDTSATLINPPVLTLSTIETNATCNTTNDGSATAVPGGGVTPYTYNWSNGATTATTTNLLPGTYTVTLTDSTNCSMTDVVIVGSDTSVIAKPGNDTSVCAGSPITLNGSGSINATAYEWFAVPRTLQGTTVSVTVTPAATTQYMLVVTDGSCRDSAVMTVTVNALPAANAGTMQTIILGSSATIGGTPTGPAGSTYLWEPSNGIDSILANPVVSPTVTTVYTVTVTSPFGCISTDTVTVYVLPQFIPPSGFTPNGDGTNDTWVLPGIENFPNIHVEIFNRWGEKVFTSVGYSVPWNGTYDSQPLPVGTYYYIITLNDPRFPAPFTGPVTIMR